MKTKKRPFKLNILGIFRLETENMFLWEILLVIALVMIFVITAIILLKTYVLPVLSVHGIITKLCSAIESAKTRSP